MVDPFSQYSLQGPRTYDNGIRVGQVRIDSGNRGKPNFLGGAVDVGVGNENLRVPNAVLQQILYSMGVNKGRLGMGEFFGQRNLPQDQPNTSYATLQGLIDRAAPKESRLWASGQPLSAMDDPIYQKRAVDTELNGLMGQPSLTETRDSAGNVLAGNVQRAQELRKQARTIQQPNLRLAAARRADAARPVNDILRQMQQYRPTTSNLQFNEKIA